METPARFRAKLDRAGELWTVIHTELAAYYDSDQFAFRTDTLNDPPRMLVYVKSMRDPPLRLGVLMGDFIHNLRSTLDHLVWQLALTRTGEPSERLQFPIYLKRPESWQSIAADRLKDVPPEAVDIIEGLQPYHAERPITDALAVIQALSNEDKHRVILETLTATAEPDPSGFSVEGTDVADDLELVFIGERPSRWASWRQPSITSPQVLIRASISSAPSQWTLDLGASASGLPPCLASRERLFGTSGCSTHFSSILERSMPVTHPNSCK